MWLNSLYKHVKFQRDRPNVFGRNLANRCYTCHKSMLNTKPTNNITRPFFFFFINIHSLPGCISVQFSPFTSGLGKCLHCVRRENCKIEEIFHAVPSLHLLLHTVQLCASNVPLCMYPTEFIPLQSECQNIDHFVTM